MRIPQSQSLVSQSFNSEKVEFVWRFNDKQFILGVNVNGAAYIEAGEVLSDGEYVQDTGIWFDFSTVKRLLMDWDATVGSWDYNFFSNGKDLIPLMEDVVKYLQIKI